MLAGLWTHRDILEDRFLFSDLLDAHEFLDVKAANEAAVARWREEQR